MSEEYSGPVVRVDDVEFQHPHLTVFHDVNLEIYPGERLALLGPNGSGKSTLLRICAGALEPTHGHCELDGNPYQYNRKGRNAIRRKVQMVVQDPDEQLFATSVAADVSYGPVNQKLTSEEVEKRVQDAMAAAEVTELADRVPHQLSYGQRKRVALAGALAMDPDVLLLDEPSAGLDPAASRQLMDTLARLHDRGTAVVMATHEIDLAWEFAERAAIIVDGTLVTGPAKDVLKDTDLIKRARLGVPWAPVVSRALGRTVVRSSDVLAGLDE